MAKVSKTVLKLIDRAFEKASYRKSGRRVYCREIGERVEIIEVALDSELREAHEPISMNDRYIAFDAGVVLANVPLYALYGQDRRLKKGPCAVDFSNCPAWYRPVCEKRRWFRRPKHYVNLVEGSLDEASFSIQLDDVIVPDIQEFFEHFRSRQDALRFFNGDRGAFSKRSIGGGREGSPLRTWVRAFVGAIARHPEAKAFIDVADQKSREVTASILSTAVHDPEKYDYRKREREYHERCFGLVRQFVDGDLSEAEYGNALKHVL
ncbi:MAG: hypothetical protein AAFR17_18740 [Pseudomonadota bacterium]